MLRAFTRAGCGGFTARLVRRLRPFVAVTLVYLMTPMATEVTEDLAQLALTGHTVHEDGPAQPERGGTEHGCSGSHHLCSCCHSAAFVVSSVQALPPVAPSKACASTAIGSVHADGHLGAVFRPPIA